MGSSNRKKKEKRKDFAKPKLKVGKTKAKPANFTSTSFKSKGIVVGQQSLQTTTHTASVKLLHNVSLLTHHSPSTRRDALAYITSTIGITSPLGASIIPTLAPLILDTSHIVRAQLLVLFNTIKDVAELINVDNADTASGRGAVRMYVQKYLLYIQSAMTHIAADVRADSTSFLLWLLKMVGVDAIRGVRGWTKTLNCWMVLLGFEVKKKKNTGLHQGNGIGTVTKSMAAVEFADAGKMKKAVLQHLSVLKEFLDIGMSDISSGSGLESQDWRGVYLVPKSSNVFSRLSLFGQEEEGGEDIQSRRKIWEDEFSESMKSGLEGKISEGGEMARIASAVMKIIPTAS